MFKMSLAGPTINRRKQRPRVEAAISTLRMASRRGRGGSTPNNGGSSPFYTQPPELQNHASELKAEIVDSYAGCNATATPGLFVVAGGCWVRPSKAGCHSLAGGRRSSWPWRPGGADLFSARKDAHKAPHASWHSPQGKRIADCCRLDEARPLALATQRSA
jgi:hypothetical protein